MSSAKRFVDTPSPIMVPAPYQPEDLEVEKVPVPTNSVTEQKAP